MAVKAISYNSFNLQDTSFRTKDIIYRNFPEKVIDVELKSRRDGFLLVDTYYSAKDISISGTLTRDTEANLKTSLDSMKEALHTDEAALDIDDGGTTIRYVASVVSIDIPEEHYHITHVPYRITFRAQPFGHLTSSTTSTNTITSSPYSTTINPTGSASPSPILKWTYSGTPSTTLVDSYSETNSSVYYYFPVNKVIGQSFTNTNAGTLDSCKFYLKKTGSPSGNANARVWAHIGTYGTDGKPTGSALAVSDNFDMVGLADSAQLITFNFSGANRIALNATTYYVVTFSPVTGSETDYPQIGVDESASTHSGNISISDDGGSTWSTNPYDVPFYVYAEVAPGVTQIVFSNTSTGDSMTVPSLALDTNNDYLSIDTDALTCKVSHDGGAETDIDFTGVFPRFNATSNSYSVTITGTGNWSLAQSIIYYPAYL